MSYGIINPSERQKRAWKSKSWKDLCEDDPHFQTPFGAHDGRGQRLQQRVLFSDQAAGMLGTLNDFDRAKVLEEIIALTYNPNPQDAKKHWRNALNRFIKSRYPFGSYHYLINYEVESSGKVAVKEVLFDRQLTGVKESYANERPMMYNVRRENGLKYDNPMTLDQSDALQEAWELGKPTHQMTTDYAAVNGMQNNLGKAAWLMGVHLDNAYRTANPNEYTLCHNPTEGCLVDLVECLWDKSPLASHNAMHLSAVLRQRQQSAQPARWVMHSQGAIIFCAAVAYHNLNFAAMPLDKHTVAVHAPGAHLDNMRKVLGKAAIKIERVRQNPFDAVPNVAGGNDLRTSSLWRSLRFLGLTLGENGGHLGVSPHTLPYLGLRTYQKQLEMAGQSHEAARVKRYIAQRDLARQKRRGR